MTELLADFIHTLRYTGHRISTSEAVLAGEVLNLVGYDDKAILKAGLSQVLAKTCEEKESFYDIFDMFFSMEIMNDSMIEALPEEQKSLLDILEEDDRVALMRLMAQAASPLNFSSIRAFLSPQGFISDMMDGMGASALDMQIMSAVSEGRMADAERISKAKEGLGLKIASYVERQVRQFSENARELKREESLPFVRLTAIEEYQMATMRALVKKMAKRLVSLYARRKKVSRRGHLDVRMTIRRNIQYDGILFNTVWKRKKIDRPKVMVLCDVSRSVSEYAKFLLMFIYSVQEVLPKVRSFAFCDSLIEVTDCFNEYDFEKAMNEAMLAAKGKTSYGNSLEDFEKLAMADVDRKTTVIILGDARSNNDDPKEGILKQIHGRARRVIFLNPENKVSWGTGDSEMYKYLPYCHKASVCASLKDLEALVSDILRRS